MEPATFESVSTWRQPTPGFVSGQRDDLIGSLAGEVCAIRPGRVRVAIDGFTAAGKTSFGHELAVAIRRRGRPTMRASLDDFKFPWRHAIEHGYDRTSGEGYYRNAYDFESARELLLRPASAEGSGAVVLCAHDPLTGDDHRDITVTAAPDAVLIVDPVFAMRPEYAAFWDLTVWLDVPEALSLERGVGRDATREGRPEALALHAERYQPAERIYLDEVDPRSRADVVIDNTDFAAPTRRR